jgi:alpha-L-fucosidase
MGPKKDLIAGWEMAARRHGLRFGVSNHSSHAWHWYQKAYAYDVDGPLKGVRYDGWMTKADGKGEWWDGYDPQELYGGNHYAPPPGFETKEEMKAWFERFDKWYNTIPERDNGYALKWFLRCQELVDKYRPDLLYFDDHGLPLEQYGLKIAAHFYNANRRWNGGQLEAVINAKKTSLPRRRAFVLDIERAGAGTIDPLPWQTDDCIGVWHYRKGQNYKRIEDVIRNFVDIVSKNGNLLLSIPIRSDGTIDEYGHRFLDDLGVWMEIHGEAIYGTRPWKIYGEGQTNDQTTESFGDGEVEIKTTRKLDSDDLRFTTKGGHLYVFSLGVPEGDIIIKSLGRSSEHYQSIDEVRMVGSHERIVWQQGEDSLRITRPAKFPSNHAIAFELK